MEGKGSASGGDHDKSLTQELLNLSESEALDPKTKDEAMNLAMKLYKKMKEIEYAAKKEEEEKKKAEEEDARKKALEDEERKKKDVINVDESTLESMVKEVMKKLQVNHQPESSNSKAESKKGEVKEYHCVSFDYSLSTTPTFSSAPLEKVPTLNELNYDEWSNKMQYYLFGIHPSLWEVVNVGIYKPNEDEEMTPEMVQDMHRNAQAVSILLGHLEGEEYRRVEGLKDAKLIWDTIKMSHEGDSKSRRQRIEVVEGQLSHFAMRRDESLKSLFDRLMTLVNKIRALGSKEWKDDNKVTRLLMRAYQVKDKNLAKIIKDRDDYEDMKPHHLYAKLQQHEAEDEAADQQIREVKALAARKSNNHNCQKDDEGEHSSSCKHKKVVEESSSDEESSSEDEEENVAMFIKSFRKMVKGGDKYHRKGKKRPCYKCGKSGHFIAECPNKGQEGNEFKKEYKKDKYKRGEKNKGYYKKSKRGHAHIGEAWNSEEESSSSEDEKVASTAIQNPSSSPRHFTNLSDDEDDYTPTCLMAKGAKVNSKTALSIEHDERSFKDKMIKEFGEKAYNIIIKLTEKLEKRKMTLIDQEDLLILEKERNLELQETLTKENDKVEVLTRELSLVKAAMEEKDVELVNVKSSMDELKDAKNVLQQNISSLEVRYKELEVQFDTLWNTTSISSSVTIDSSASTSDGCKKCYNQS